MIKGLFAVAALAVAGAAAVPQAMNDIQVVGSHNSFKARIPAAVMAKMREVDPKMADALDYHHVPLAAQLDAGVRQLELDVFADPAGGRYADPGGEALARAAGEKTSFDRAAMLKPGFKVFHIPDVDYLSTCATLLGCLHEIDGWSRAHPQHLPIMITINAADRPSTRPGVTSPLSLADAGLLDSLDAEIRAAFPGKRLITPDEVRGSAPTLRDAVLSRGWPALSAARGRIYVLLDVRAAVSDVYRVGHPSLAGRAMFGWYPQGQPEAAVQIVQDPLVDGGKIRKWVSEGVIVRTRTDANTLEARRRDYSKAKAAMASGAQAVSTDYYPGAPDPLDLGFVVTLPKRAMARCSIARVPRGCRLRP